MITLIYGSARFAGMFTNNLNDVAIGDFDRPTKLVDSAKNVRLCLPDNVHLWGMYPTHQEAWLCLSFIVACHARHVDDAGLAVRRQAWAAIPAEQWLALAAKAAEFAAEFRERLTAPGLNARKAYKSATRALQDCLLYAAVREFPKDQDQFLATSAVAALIARANTGRAGTLTDAEGVALADEIDAMVADVVGKFGGIEACRKALADLPSSSAQPGRVILLPEGMTLARGADLIRADVVIGIPDAHDMDVVSIVEGQGAPELIQLTDALSGQRMDIMAVSPTLAADEHLTGGHPAFQSVAEMLLANGTARTADGGVLVNRLSTTVDPLLLAAKYREIARDFWKGAQRKSWASRRSDPLVAAVKKAIPLYRIACDLLPRASFMERTGTFPGGQDMFALASAAGLGEAYTAIRQVLDRQTATNEELEAIADMIHTHIH